MHCTQCTMTTFDANVGDGFNFDRYGTRKYIGKEQGKHVFDPVLGEPTTEDIRLTDNEVLNEINRGRMEPNGRTYPVSQTTEYEADYRSEYETVH